MWAGGESACRQAGDVAACGKAGNIAACGQAGGVAACGQAAYLAVLCGLYVLGVIGGLVSLFSHVSGGVVRVWWIQRKAKSSLSRSVEIHPRYVGTPLRTAWGLVFPLLSSVLPRQNPC